MDNQEDDVIEMPSELDSLKAKADLLGVSYHPSIGAEKLREKINAALSGQDGGKVEAPVKAAGETESERKARKRREASELIRIRVTCMNPFKNEWEGEIFTAGNAAVGTFKKYVPFNADEGWHVPRIIYNQMVERQCQVFVTRKDERGRSIREGKLIKEFAIEVLDPLTTDELAELARRQAMAQSIG